MARYDREKVKEVAEEYYYSNRDEIFPTVGLLTLTISAAIGTLATGEEVRDNIPEWIIKSVLYSPLGFFLASLIAAFIVLPHIRKKLDRQ